MLKRRLDDHTNTKHSWLTARLESFKQLGVARYAGPAAHAKRLVATGDHEQETNTPAIDDAVQNVCRLVAGSVGNDQAVVIEHTHKAGRAATRRDIDTRAVSGSDQYKWGVCNQYAAVLVESVNAFLLDRIGRRSVDRFELVDGGDDIWEIADRRHLSSVVILA